MKFVHAADLHLDSPMRGLPVRELAPTDQLRGATRHAFVGLVDYCVEEGVGLLLLAGDLFDGDWRCHSSWLFFASQLRRLEQAGIRVVMLRGNHDAASVLTRSVSLPSNVTDLSTRAPETVVFEELNVAVHGQGFAKRTEPRDLASGYPDPVPGKLNVGMLHTSLGGYAAHETYAPCSVSTLEGKGYDYWALGHVHAHEVVLSNPWIVYSGNLQGRSVRETGPKGAVVVEYTNAGVSSVSHHTFDTVRWASLEVDLTGCALEDELVQLACDSVSAASEAAGGKLLAVRLRFVGKTPLHGELPKRVVSLSEELQANLAATADVWIERVIVRTEGCLDLQALRARDDFLGKLSQALEELRTDPEQREELFECLAPLERKLNQTRGLRASDVGLSPDALPALLDDVEQSLMARLLSDEALLEERDGSS